MRKIKYYFFLILLFPCVIKAQQDTVPDFYPLGVGDYTEFYGYPTLDSTFTYGVTLIREVIKDTLINKLSYKIVKWCSCANTIDIIPTYEYQRLDQSGEVYTYYQGRDILLFDFNYNTGDIYPSPYEGLRWKVFNSGSYIYSIGLIDSIENIVGGIQFEEGKGIVYFNKIYEGFSYANYWGSIINEVVDGRKNLIKNTSIESFYPQLNIGNRFYYKYEKDTDNGFFVREVLGDTILQDGYVYKKIYNRFINIEPFTHAIEYERLDNSGTYYTSDGNTTEVKFKFSLCIGDTFYGKTFYYNTSEFWRLTNKDLLGNSLDYSLDFSPGLNNLNWMVVPPYNWGPLLLAYEDKEETFIVIATLLNGQLTYGDTTFITSVLESSGNNFDNFSLSQNYPNPFNPTTQINYSLQESNFVSLKVYNSIGEFVSTLVNEEKPAGSYSVTFVGSELPSGIYFYRITSGSFNQTRKMILLK